MKPLAIMPTYVRSEDDWALTKTAAHTLLVTADIDLYIIDDGSPRADLIEEHKDYLVINCEENQGFSHAVNLGLRQARREQRDALLVNADMEFTANNWLERMQENDADVVGALLCYPNGLIQHAGIFYSIITRQFDHIYRMAPRTLELAQKPRTCPVTGALMYIRHNTLTKVGVFDENFKMGYEDISYCHDVFSAGLKCAYEPKAVATHYERSFRDRNPSKKHIKWWEDSFDYLHNKHSGLSFADYTPSMLYLEDYE